MVKMSLLMRYLFTAVAPGNSVHLKSVLMSTEVKDCSSVLLGLLLHGDISRKRWDGAASSHLDDRRLVRRLECTVTGGQEVSSVPFVVGVELEVAFPPKHPQDLLLQHGLHLHASLQLLQPLGVLAHVEALNLLVGAVQLLQAGLAARVRCHAVALEVEPQAAHVDVVAVAVRAFVWTLAGVQALVQFEVDELGELGRAELAVVRLLS